MSWLQSVRDTVNARLENFFAKKRQEVRTTSPAAKHLVEPLAELTERGGKRVRPAVLASGYFAVQHQTPLEWLWDAAAAQELLQSYLLIHDDWMDQDDLRRGGLSLHAHMQQQHADAHLGASLAVLTGDLACTYAWELMLGAVSERPERIRALDVFHKMQEDVVFGQQLDLLGHADVEKMQSLKTGSYTVVGPLRIGAILGGASEAQTQALSRFAAPLGVAFQLRDDLLDTFGQSERTGKPVGSDLRRGKRTIVNQVARERLTPQQAQQLDSVFGHPEVSDERIAELVAVMRQAEVPQAIEERLDALVEQALSALQEASFGDVGLKRLKEVAAYLTAREV